MMPRSSVLLATRTKRTKHSSAPAGIPAFVDAVEHGEFGTATVTATLFGGIGQFPLH
jgi:hypothetical protein